MRVSGRNQVFCIVFLFSYPWNTHWKIGVGSRKCLRIFRPLHRLQIIHVLLQTLPFFSSETTISLINNEEKKKSFYSRPARNYLRRPLSLPPLPAPSLPFSPCPLDAYISGDHRRYFLAIALFLLLASSLPRSEFESLESSNNT